MIFNTITFDKKIFLLISILLPTLFGIIAITLGQDNFWDLRNYHYYNPYALMYGRFLTDIQVSQLQTYFNPTLDLLFYSLIENFHPKVATFLMAFIQGINGPLIMVLFFILLQKVNPPIRTTYVIGLSILALYAPIMISQIGASSNDLTPSILIICALIVTVLSIQQRKDVPNKYLLLSGLLIGASTGLKLTQAPYGIAYTAAILLLPGSMIEKSKKGLFTVIALLLGLILTSGWWMVYMWLYYDNPLFPYYNDIFHSSLILEKNWSDNRFIPQSFFEHLSLPFKWLYKNHFSDRQLLHQDSRYAIIYITSIILLIKCLWHRLRKIGNQKQSESKILPLEHFFIVIFFFTAYIVWQLKFSILRYTHVLEMLAPFIILIIILNLINNTKLKWIILCITSVIILIQLTPPHIDRLPFKDTFFRVTFPELNNSKNTMLLIAGGRPWGYLTSDIPKEMRIIRITSNLIKKDHQVGMKNQIIKTIRAHEGPIYLLTREQLLRKHYDDLRAYNLDINSKNALRIYSDHEPPGLLIVEVIKPPLY